MKKTQNVKSNSIKNIRERLGGSQQWWADYLSISRSLIKMVEAGLRTLPAAALLKLSAIELLPPVATNTVGSKAPKAKTSKSNPFTTQVRKLELQLHRTQQVLETAQQRYTQALAADTMSTQLLQQSGTTEEDKKDKLLLKAMQLQAERDEEKYGTAARALVQWKINCLTYAIAEAKKWTPEAEEK